jgi:hypothetical protein
MGAMIQLQCVKCGAEFASKTRRRQHCSNRCRKNHTYDRIRVQVVEMARNCLKCGAGFTTKDARKVYCGRICMRTAGDAKRDRSPADETVKAERRCANCGGSFLTASPQRMCCSDRCTSQRRTKRHSEYQRQRWAAVAKQSPERTAPERPRCKGCNQLFRPSGPGVRYCKSECRRKRANERRQDYRAKARQSAIRPTDPVETWPDQAPKPRIRYDRPGPITGKGFTFSGFSEAAPRQAVTTVAGCPRCRRYGTDTLGRQNHDSWCPEAP